MAKFLAERGKKKKRKIIKHHFWSALTTHLGAIAGRREKEKKSVKNYANFFSPTASDLVWKFVRPSLTPPSISPSLPLSLLVCCHCPLGGALCDLLARLVKSRWLLKFANNHQYIKSVFSLDLKTIQRHWVQFIPPPFLSFSLSVSLLTFPTIFIWKCAAATSQVPFLSLFLHFFENMSSKVENEVKLEKKCE